MPKKKKKKQAKAKKPKKKKVTLKKKAPKKKAAKKKTTKKKAPKAPSPGQAKKDVFAKLKKKIKFDPAGTGLAEAEVAWNGTLGNFFTRYGVEAEKKWKKAKLRKYAMRCVEDIATDAAATAGPGGFVDAAIFQTSAKKILQHYRDLLCPSEVAGSGPQQPNSPQPNSPPPNSPPPQNTAIHGQLCELY